MGSNRDVESLGAVRPEAPLSGRRVTGSRPWLVADTIPPAIDPALLHAVRRWRRVRAELALGRLLDEPWRRSA